MAEAAPKNIPGDDLPPPSSQPAGSLDSTSPQQGAGTPDSISTKQAASTPDNSSPRTAPKSRSSSLYSLLETYKYIASLEADKSLRIRYKDRLTNTILVVACGPGCHPCDWRLLQPCLPDSGHCWLFSGRFVVYCGCNAFRIQSRWHHTHNGAPACTCHLATNVGYGAVICPRRTQPGYHLRCPVNLASLDSPGAAQEASSPALMIGAPPRFPPCNLPGSPARHHQLYSGATAGSLSVSAW